MSIIKEKVAHAELVGGGQTSLHSHGGGEAFPVNSVFISVVNTNPSILLGYGTWVAFGPGRVVVGVDTGQTEFNTVEKTGGSKTANYDHSVVASNIRTGGNITAGALDHSNMSIVQPYITAYFWKRTA